MIARGQIREEVLLGQRGDRARLGRRGRASVEIWAVAPRGKTRVTCDLAVSSEGETRRARGHAELSLSAIGVLPVKGPMGAFRVKDRVRIEFDLVFGA